MDEPDGHHCAICGLDCAECEHTNAQRTSRCDCGHESHRRDAAGKRGACRHPDCFCWGDPIEGEDDEEEEGFRLDDAIPRDC